MAELCLSKNDILYKGKILRLRIKDASICPAWLDNNCSVPIIIPCLFKNTHKGEILAEFEYNGNSFPAIVRNGDKTFFAFDPIQTIDFLVNEKYFVKKAVHNFLLLSRLGPVIPPGMRKLAKQITYRLFKNSEESFPSWPIERSVELLRHIVSQVALEKRDSLWPAGKTFALAFSHDIDSLGGFANIDKIHKTEERYGVKSTWFVVGDQIEKREDALKSLLKSGHELGLHGARHDHLYSSSDSGMIRMVLNKYKDIIARFGMKGFRSPYLGRSAGLFEALQNFFEYDSSVPDTALLSPDPFVKGSCTVLPYKLGKLIEIPITLPLDSALLFLGYKEDDIFNVWKKKTEWVKGVGGVAVLNTHAESHFLNAKGMMRAYERFVEWAVGNKDAWITNLCNIAEVKKEYNIDSVVVKEYVNE